MDHSIEVADTAAQVAVGFGKRRLELVRKSRSKILEGLLERRVNLLQIALTLRFGYAQLLDDALKVLDERLR